MIYDSNKNNYFPHFRDTVMKLIQQDKRKKIKQMGREKYFKMYSENEEAKPNSSLFGAVTAGEPLEHTPEEIKQLQKQEELLTKTDGLQSALSKKRPLVFKIDSLILDDKKVTKEMYKNMKLVVDISEKQFLIIFESEESSRSKKQHYASLAFKFKTTLKFELSSSETTVRCVAADYDLQETTQENLKTMANAQSADFEDIFDFKISNKPLPIQINFVDESDGRSIGSDQNLLNWLVVAGLKINIDGQPYKMKVNPKFDKGQKYYPTYQDKCKHSFLIFIEPIAPGSTQTDIIGFRETGLKLITTKEEYMALKNFEEELSKKEKIIFRNPRREKN